MYMEIKQIKKEYPKTYEIIGNQQLIVRLMKKKDIKQIIDFFTEIPDNEKIYYRVNMFNQKDLEDYWKTRVLKEKSITLLAFMGDELVGITSLHRASAPPSAQVAYMRLLTSSKYRGRGIASILSSEMFKFALILKVEKLCSEFTTEQELAAQIFEDKLGFKKEAVLKNHVRDSAGKTYDLTIFSSNPKKLVKDIKRRTVFSAANLRHEY